jgi:hypothetical protein
MAAPNLAKTTHIYGKTSAAALSTTLTTNLLECPSNKVLKINTIIASNVDGTNAYDLTVSFYDASATTAFALASTVSVPADATLVVLSKESPIYLEEGDQIQGGAGAASDGEIVISYEEISD